MNHVKSFHSSTKNIHCCGYGLDDAPLIEFYTYSNMQGISSLVEAELYYKRICNRQCEFNWWPGIQADSDDYGDDDNDHDGKAARATEEEL